MCPVTVRPHFLCGALSCTLGQGSDLQLPVQLHFIQLAWNTVSSEFQSLLRCSINPRTHGWQNNWLCLWHFCLLKTHFCSPQLDCGLNIQVVQLFPGGGLGFKKTVKIFKISPMHWNELFSFSFKCFLVLSFNAVNQSLAAINHG